jgi:hypothetical protein
MVLLYIVNRLRLKTYFEIKWSKLKIKQYYISSNRLSRDIWTSRKHFSGHRDAKSKTGDNPGFPGRMATLYLFRTHYEAKRLSVLSVLK